MNTTPFSSFLNPYFSSVQSLSRVWLCDPMDWAGFPVHHQLLELAQTHVHWVGNAIQPSHPLSSSSPPAFSLSQHQSFLRSKFFASGGQSIRVSASASASVLPMNIQDWFPLGLTGLISLLFKRFSRVFSNTTVQKCSAFFKVQLLHPYMTTGKTVPLTRWTFVGKVMSLLFNMLSRLVITFLPRSKCLLISRLQADKTWFPGEGNGRPLEYSCLENPMNSMTRQNPYFILVMAMT